MAMAPVEVAKDADRLRVAARGPGTAVQERRHLGRRVPQAATGPAEAARAQAPDGRAASRCPWAAATGGGSAVLCPRQDQLRIPEDPGWGPVTLPDP